MRFFAGMALGLSLSACAQSNSTSHTDDPDLGVKASTPGLAGKLGHGAANAVGTVGEWVDRRAGR